MRNCALTKIKTSFVFVLDLRYLCTMILKEAIEQLRSGLAGVAEPQEVQAMIRVICEDIFN